MWWKQLLYRLLELRESVIDNNNGLSSRITKIVARLYNCGGILFFLVSETQKGGQ